MYSISQVSRALCVSTRALRYWEQMGLIQSVKQPENGYRTYDRAAIQRAEQIAVLRRLRIPIRQIGEILDAPGAQPAIGAVEAALAQTDRAACKRRWRLRRCTACCRRFLPKRFSIRRKNGCQKPCFTRSVPFSCRR